MKKWLDYHTHKNGCEKYVNDPEVIVVQSLQLGETPHVRADYLTIGLHPMSLESKALMAEPTDKVKQILKNAIADAPKPVIAIGECGWDNRSSLSEDLQDLLMEIQISVAEELGLPLILHIVSYWHVLLKKQKDHRSIPWVVHGFRGKPQLASQLLNAGIHLSIHPTLIEHTSELTESFFIETDESTADLRSLYRQVANQKGVSEEVIKEKTINYFYNLHLL